MTTYAGTAKQGVAREVVAFLGDAGLSPVTVTVRKAGGAFAVPAVGTDATEIAGGWYSFPSTAADWDTVGPILWRFYYNDDSEAYVQYDVTTGRVLLENASIGAATFDAAA